MFSIERRAERFEVLLLTDTPNSLRSEKGVGREEGEEG